MVQNDAIRVEKTNANTSIFPLCPTICDVPVTVKVEDSEILLNSVDNGGTGNESFQLDFPVLMVKEEIYESNFDDLDHVVLKERQRMLLARYLMFIVDFFPSLVGWAIKHTFCLFNLFDFVS